MGSSFMIESQAVLELGGGNGDTVFRQNATGANYILFIFYHNKASFPENNCVCVVHICM